MTNYILRNKIKDIISECSTCENINENNSIASVKLNKDKLLGLLRYEFGTDCGLFNIEFSNTTTIEKVIDVILRKMPKSTKECENSSNYSNEVNNHIREEYNDSIFFNNNRKYEYVIGIDFGHGETSAAICALNWDMPVERLEPVIDLDMGGNKKVIPSAISILENGTAYIGDSAFNPEILQQAEVHVCFKKAPKDIKGKDEKLMIKYMQEVYKRIRENNSALLTNDNHIVYIATPSAWDKPTQALYFKMAQTAGLPIGGLTKESRAAFVKAQHDSTSGMQKFIEKGAVVLDMGSSTLDLTYMSSEHNIIDFGYNSGASFIEKSIYNNYKIKDQELINFENKYARLVNHILFEIRKLKEKVYFDTSLLSRTKIDFEEIVIGDEEFQDKCIRISYKPGELNLFLEQVGYINTIENNIYDFLHNKINNAPIYGVFLTGGASRMDFLIPLICKCWKVPENNIFRDQDPSLTISQGVAEVARMDIRTRYMDNGLEEAIDYLQKNDDIYNCFKEKFSNELWNDITNEIAEVLSKFNNSSNDYSLNDLKYTITIRVKDAINKILPNTPLYIDDAISKKTKDIQNQVENIIAHYSKQGIKIEKPNLSINSFYTENININGVINSISEKIAKESYNWASDIAGDTIVKILAVLDPLGIILGSLNLLGKIFFDGSEEEKKKKVSKKRLSKTERQKVYESILHEWNNIQENVRYAINESVNNNPDIKNSINKVIFQVLQSYKDNLKKVRILID